MTSPEHKAKIEAKEWLISVRQRGAIIDPKNHMDEINFTAHVIEHKAYASALEDIRLLALALDKAIAWISPHEDDFIIPLRKDLRFHRDRITEKYPEIKEKA